MTELFQLTSAQVHHLRADIAGEGDGVFAFERDDGSMLEPGDWVHDPEDGRDFVFRGVYANGCFILAFWDHDGENGQVQRCDERGKARLNSLTVLQPVNCLWN